MKNEEKNFQLDIIFKEKKGIVWKKSKNFGKKYIPKAVLKNKCQKMDEKGNEKQPNGSTKSEEDFKDVEQEEKISRVSRSKY